MLPVKSAVVGSTPGHAGGRALRHSDTTQQTTTHQRGGLGVCRGVREEREPGMIEKEKKLNQLCACHKLMLEQFPKQLCVCAYAPACSLTGKKRVGARQARLVGGIPPTQPPQAAAALLHLHQGGVMNAREVLATPRRVTLATHTHALEKKHTEIRFENGQESEGHRKGQ